eukprot:CCRYP_012197-RA/>CCRYP_012197-RA protein AED:0.04 eAED:0.04 QI:35/1/1/1/0/0/2/692/199
MGKFISALGQHQPLERSVAGLSTTDRESLLQEVWDCLHHGLASCEATVPPLVSGKGIEVSSENIDYHDVESGICELESVLKECRELLVSFEVKERFLGMRICTYRRRLEQRGGSNDEMVTNISCSENISDGEAEGRIHSQQGRYCQDELQSVEKAHIGIIAQMEMLRRTIYSLEDKTKNYISMRDECRQFVSAAVSAEC